MNINAAATGTRADVTKNAQILVRLVQAANAGTAQSVRTNQAVNNITESVILLIRDVLAIRAPAGVVIKIITCKMELGQQLTVKDSIIMVVLQVDVCVVQRFQQVHLPLHLAQHKGLPYGVYLMKLWNLMWRREVVL